MVEHQPSKLDTWVRFPSPAFCMEKNMKNLFADYRNFIKSHVGLLIFNTAAAALVFGIALISNTVFVDTDTMLNHQGSSLDWLPIGRWGSVLIQKLFHLSAYNPYVSMCFGLVFIILFLETYSYFFYMVSGRKELPFWIFTGLFISHPIFVFQWNFQLQNAEVAFSIFLTAAALILIFAWLENGSRLLLALGILAMPVAFTTYETNYALYISGALIGFLFLSGLKKGKEAWGTVLKLAVTFLAGAAVGFFISRIFLNRAIDDAYGSIWWLTKPGEAAAALKSYFAAVLGGSGTFYGHCYQVLLFACVLLLIFRRKEIRDRIRLEGAPAVIAAVLFLFSAFLMPVLQGHDSTYRNQYNLPFVTASGIMALWWLLKRREECPAETGSSAAARPHRTAAGLRRAACCLLLVASCFLMLLQSQVTLRLWYTDRVRYDQDCRMLDSVMDDMHEAGISEVGKSVIYVGLWSAPLNAACFTYQESIGLSFFQISHSFTANSDHLKSFARIRGYNVAEVTDAQAQQASAAGRDMPSWPNEGYIREIGNVIVVKLSDY